MTIYSGLLAATVLLSLAGAAEAQETTPQDVQIIGRAMSFTQGAKRQPATLAVVFDGADPVSVLQKNATLAAVGKGLSIGERTLVAVAVEQSQLGSASGYDGVFTTAGVDQTRLRRFLSRSGVPCFTLDTAQVSEGACAVAVRSRPKVTISFSSSNAAAADVKFATAFIMMVREL